jgi:hypothetical protein
VDHAWENRRTRGTTPLSDRAALLSTITPLDGGEGEWGAMSISVGGKVLVVLMVAAVPVALGACKVVDDVGSAASSALGARDECQPNCAGMDCGDDGCGGSCGSCSWGQTCSWSGHCECTPNCGGSRCGDDGCGGSCGSCGSHEECQSGSCVCVHSCSGIQCGDDGCGGWCGECPSGLDCLFGSCVCTPYCGDARCGDDGCGGSCGSCVDWEVCSGGRCRPRPPVRPDCTHPLSETGVPLNPECSPCVAKVCEDKPACCSLRWDSSCTRAADTVCPGHT